MTTTNHTTVNIDNMIGVKFDVDIIDINEFQDWLNTSPSGGWFVGFGEVYFDKPEDAVLFKLRW